MANVDDDDFETDDDISNSKVKGPKVLPIGIGEGGSKLAKSIALALDASKNLVYYNTSAKDLKGAKINGDEFSRTIKIGKESEVEGAGKDRSVGNSLLKENKNVVSEGLLNYASETDYDFIFVVFSTAGGTGSGMGPKITALMNSEEFLTSVKTKTGKKPYVFGIAALPEITHTEGTLSYENTLECMEEIKKFVSVGRYFLINNGAVSGKIKNAERTKQLDDINHNVARILRRYLVNYGVSRISTLDRADRYGALNVMGIHAFEVLSPEGTRQITPFFFPDGERVKRCCYEVPSKMENLAMKAVSSSGAICDDIIHGLYDEDNTENSGLIPIIGYHGYTNVAKIAEAYDKRLKLIRENATRIEKDNVFSSTGLDDVANERSIREKEYGSRGLESIDSIFND